MSVSGVSNSAVPNPMLTLAQAQQSETSALFGNDSSSMEATGAAYSLYNDPQLLMQLQQWDGSDTPGSQRVAAIPANPAAQVAQPKWEFNPFDQKTWDVQPAGSSVDVSA
jgi:hypothetical protein